VLKVGAGKLCVGQIGVLDVWVDSRSPESRLKSSATRVWWVGGGAGSVNEKKAGALLVGAFDVTRLDNGANRSALVVRPRSMCRRPGSGIQCTRLTPGTGATGRPKTTTFQADDCGFEGLAWNRPQSCGGPHPMHPLPSARDA